MIHLFANRNLHSSDMNGLVQKALDASNVYENIANYVNEANETAEFALNITERIYDVSIHLFPYVSILNRARGFGGFSNTTGSAWSLSGPCFLEIGNGHVIPEADRTQGLGIC